MLSQVIIDVNKHSSVNLVSEIKGTYGKILRQKLIPSVRLTLCSDQPIHDVDRKPFEVRTAI